MSISLEGVTKFYGKEKAVDNLSFTAESGRVLGFLGPNGAGKSTTLKMIAGVLTPSEGHIHLNGKLIEESEAQKRIGYLPEANPLYPELYVRESMEFYARIQKIPNAKDAISRTIERVGLGPVQYKKVAQLSKGFKQRLGLAQTILHDPEILILDEPISGLDPNQLIEIRELITELGTSKTVIFSSHILQEVEAVCDDLLIINKGKEVYYGDIEEFKNSRTSTAALEVVFEKEVHVSEFERYQLNILSGNGSRFTFDLENDGLLTKRKIFELTVATSNPILFMSEKRETKIIEELFKDVIKDNS